MKDKQACDNIFCVHYINIVETHSYIYIYMSNQTRQKWMEDQTCKSRMITVILFLFMGSCEED